MLRDQIQSLIVELDPAGLVAQGYPVEEYDPEVDDFAAQLAKGQPLTVEKVAATLEKWYGPGSEQFIPVTLHPLLTERLNQLLG